MSADREILERALARLRAHRDEMVREGRYVGSWIALYEKMLVEALQATPPPPAAPRPRRTSRTWR